ncbi:GTP cyclohydrolase I [Microbacterium invictum]|nr:MULTISPECIES: GTP cyclohydrolase I [Microbacterium]
MSTMVQTGALHAVTDDGPIDRDRAMTAVADLLSALGRDVASEDLADTPRRVVDGFIEMLTPRPFTMTTFANDAAYDEVVVVRDIAFASICRHHLLPFRGTATVGYLPGTRLVGLSKLARIVAFHARDLQVQEDLTAQIARTLEDELAPRGVGVVIEAEHLCMSIRGVQAAGATTATALFRGELAGDAVRQARFRPV